MRGLTRLLAVVVAGAMFSAFWAIPGGAVVVDGSAASAFGVKVHANLFGEIDVALPAYPTVRAPTADAEDPDDVSQTVVGPVRIPDDGALLADLRALHVEAKRTNGDLPTAHAEAQTGHVALFEQEGTPQIEVDVIHSVADVKCTAPGKATASADGSHLVNLVLGGNPIDMTPSPNTEIPLVYTGDAADPNDDMGIRVILNEQTGAESGTGIVVTMIHAIAFSSSDPNIIFADIRIAQAKATAFCGSETAETNGNAEDRDLSSDKAATSTSDPEGTLDVDGVATAFRGDEVTWTITISNEGTGGCGVVSVIDTLPQHFTFVKSSGDLTKGVTPVVEGQTVTWSNSARYPLPAGGKIVEQVTAKVADDAPYGTYTDLVDVDESTCSTFTQGNRGPVDVIPRPAAAKPRVLGRVTLPSTGVGMPPVAAGIVLLGLGALGWVSTRRSA